jgi:hypothetical protein
MAAKLESTYIALNDEKAFVKSNGSTLQLKSNPLGDTDFLKAEFVEGTPGIPIVKGSWIGSTETGTAVYRFYGSGTDVAYINNVTIFNNGDVTDVANRLFVTNKIGKVSYSGVSSADKADILTADDQTVSGKINKYTCLSPIYMGEITIVDYSLGNVTLTFPFAVPSFIHEIAGIAKSKGFVSEELGVIRNGYVTARYVKPGMEYNTLPASTGNPVVDLNTKESLILISPNYPADYPASFSGEQIYNAGAGNTVSIEILDLEMEMTTTLASDRCGFQTSSDNITYSNVTTNFQWMNASADTAPTGYWSDVYSVAGDRDASKPGWILTQDIDTMQVLDPTHTGAWVATFPTRYVKIKMSVNGTTQRRGFQMRIFKTNVQFILTLDAPLYVSTVLPSAVTTDAASGLLVGYVIDTVADSGVWMKVEL